MHENKLAIGCARIQTLADERARENDHVFESRCLSRPASDTPHWGHFEFENEVQCMNYELTEF